LRGQRRFPTGLRYSSGARHCGPSPSLANRRPAERPYVVERPEGTPTLFVVDRRLRALAILAAAFLAGWAVFRQRPVRPPERLGAWEPLER
jgi:hypothetical protein